VKAIRNTDPAGFSLDGIEWGVPTDDWDLVAVDYRSRHAYQTTINNVVYVLRSREIGYAELRLEWWCGARHLDFQLHIGAHDTAHDAARHAAAIFTETPEYFLDEGL